MIRIMNEDYPSMEIEPSHQNVIINVLMSESSKSNYRKKYSDIRKWQRS